MTDKLVTLAGAIRDLVRDGESVVLGAALESDIPSAAAHELIRQNKHGLTVSQGVAGLDTDLLVGARAVRRLTIGGGSLDRFGPVHNINRAREQSTLTSEDWTSLSICFRYLAGALGLSFIPIKSLIASEILERLGHGAGAGEVARIVCPFTGEPYVAMKALVPDIAFVHVQMADAEGNCRIDGPRWENEEQAKAAKRLVVIAEEIVPVETIQQEPERTIIPAHRVEAVVHQPFGAHPTAVYGRYDYDAAHLKLYVEHSKRPERIGDYIDAYIRGTKDHSAYLEKIGGEVHLASLKADPALGY